MAAKIILTQFDGTPKQIVFADHAGDFSPTAANDLRDATAGNRTDTQMTFVSVVDDAAVMSAKFDFGTDWAPMKPRAAIEFAATPTAGEPVELWIGYSHSATAATGNPGGLSGSAGSYTGYSSNMEASHKQLDFIDAKPVTTQITTTVQIIEFGVFVPKLRYGIIVMINRSGAATHSDDVETHITLTPVITESQ